MIKTTRFVSLLFCVLFFCFQITGLTCYADTVNEEIIGGIVQFQLQSAGASGIQDWIDGELTRKAGISSEFYILALSRSGEQYTYSSYADALEQYLANDSYSGPTAKQKYALSLLAAGKNTAYIPEVMDTTIGQQGIMSLIYGLHLLNTGYPSSTCTAESVCEALLSMQHPDGGWSLFGENGDVDVTAMTLQALAPFAGTFAQSSIDRGVQFLSDAQLQDGGYASMGAENPESTAQVITALSALGIDCVTAPGFQKNGCTVFDALQMFRMPDGSFSHVLNGESNQLATLQVFYAMIAYRCMQQGRGSLYHLTIPQQAEPETLPVTTTASSTMVPSEKTTASQTVLTSASLQSSVTAMTETVRTTTATAPVASDTTLSHPTATETMTETVCTTDSVSVGQHRTLSSYKPAAIVLLLSAGGVMCVILLVRKKRHPKNFIAVGILTGAGILLILLTDFQTPEEYYSSSEKSAPVGNVTCTIRCDTVLGKSDADYIPENGVILPVTEFTIENGSTVFDVLSDAVRSSEIQMEYRGSGEMAYVSGIGYLYELQFGDLSGWMYHVNGTSPSVGCGAYVLQDGDSIEWLYTCDIGHDLEGGE